MLTVMAMRWNEQKFANLASTLTRRYQKVKTQVYCMHKRPSNSEGTVLSIAIIVKSCRHFPHQSFVFEGYNSSAKQVE